MAILGYFNREAREAASIDAAWRAASEALGGPSSANRSIGTTAIKTSTQSTAPSSYLATITRQASNLVSTVGLSSISDISFGSTSDGSLFEFSDAERQKARSILNDAAATTSSSSSSASATASYSSTGSGARSGLPVSFNTSPSVRSGLSSNTNYNQIHNHSPEFMARGRSSSVWSSSASVSSVSHRNRNAPRGDTVW